MDSCWLPDRWEWDAESAEEEALRFRPRPMTLYSDGGVSGSGEALLTS
jgi:hypothetical protein